ncbi:hypothetical protein CY35_18G041700 [Sphagnum magellanicum]|nr:hypothetical protein CY35_18G041700 [Sphagnum magellanicum]
MAGLPLPSLATRNTYTYCNATTAATTTSACQQQTRQETFRPSGEKAAAAAVVILQAITTAKSLNVAVTTTTTTTTTTRGSSCCKASTTQNDLLSRRQIALATLLAGVSFATNLSIHGEEAEAVSSSRRALRAEQVPESEYKTLPNGLKYYDVKVGGGKAAEKGSRVAIHYVAKWKGLTFMTSRQGMGVTGGTPYGFDVGASDYGIVLKGLDYGVAGMRVGGQRLLIVPPELAYGSRGIQEIPPNATLQFDVELLSIKQNAFGSQVKLVEG